MIFSWICNPESLLVELLCLPPSTNIKNKYIQFFKQIIECTVHTWFISVVSRR